MEDDNFIKFGPEWLRNFATRPSRRSSTRDSGPQHAPSSSGASTTNTGNQTSGTYNSSSSGAIPRTSTASRPVNNVRPAAPNANATAPTRVSLAKLRHVYFQFNMI